ncbi:MAG TPA: hypothetical protein VGS28_01705 [Candidatus Saccharimonadales bacterium]|nr:hypothetical protein [Candidatus Saccharimonadales bacterium]
MQQPGDEHGYWEKDTEGGDDKMAPASTDASATHNDAPTQDDEVAPVGHDGLPAALLTPDDPADEDDEAPTISKPTFTEAEKVSWEASEFIDHEKPASWFVVFGVFVVALLLFSVFILRDWFMAIGSAIMCVAIGVVGVRKPRVLHYAIDGTGLHIGERIYKFNDFHSFGIVKDGGLWSILLRPNARFRPMLSIYFEEGQGEKIVDVLSRFLPMENYKFDAVDRLSRKLRF